MVELRYGAATDVGRRRVNEDSWLASPPVFVVADGMGGHQAGQDASRIAVEEFAQLAGRDEVTSVDVDEVLARCRGRIADLSGAHPELAHAGTTLVGCLLTTGENGQPYWLVVNVGDSRAYRLSDAGLERVSIDHSVVQELIESGQLSEEDAHHHPERNVVTRVLGSPDSADPDYFLLSFESTRRLLLCSDGVSGALHDSEIEQLLDEVDDPEVAATQIVADAIEAGSRDNATAVVVDVVGWVEQGESRLSGTSGDDAQRSQHTLPRIPVRDRLDADSSAELSAESAE